MQKDNNNQIKKYLNEINNITQGLQKYITENHILEKVATFASKVTSGVKNHINNTNTHKNNLLEFAKNGWFISYQLSDYDRNRYFNIVDDYDYDGIKLFIHQYTTEIINDIIERNQLRKSFLLAALDAHNNKNYILSIPIFLSHADGIMQEKLKISPFLKKDKTKGYDRNIKPLKEQENFQLLQAFFPTMYIPDDNNEFGTFNRNAILHGDMSKSDYPTEENSLKAISFISYIHFMAYMLNLSKDKSSINDQSL